MGGTAPNICEICTNCADDEIDSVYNCVVEGYCSNNPFEAVSGDQSDETSDTNSKHFDPFKAESGGQSEEIFNMNLKTFDSLPTEGRTPTKSFPFVKGIVAGIIASSILLSMW